MHIRHILHNASVFTYLFLFQALEWKTLKSVKIFVADGFIYENLWKRRKPDQIMFYIFLATEEVNETIQFILATFPNILWLKSVENKCLRYFIAGEDVVAVFTMRLFTAHTAVNKLHRSGALHHT